MARSRSVGDVRVGGVSVAAGDAGDTERLSGEVSDAAGGLTRTLGNRITLPLGVVGGLAAGLASATIAFTDTFDPLFPVGSLIGVWAVAVGGMALARRS